MTSEMLMSCHRVPVDHGSSGWSAVSAMSVADAGAPSWCWTMVKAKRIVIGTIDAAALLQGDVGSAVAGCLLKSILQIDGGVKEASVQPSDWGKPGGSLAG